METQFTSPAKPSLTPELRALALPPEDLRRLVLLLIKEDLRSARLVLGLSALGLEAGRYHTELHRAIFQLLGLDQNNDALHELYFNYIDKAQQIDNVEDADKMQAMAEEIYERLVSCST